MSISCYEYGKEEYILEKVWRISANLYNPKVDGGGFLNPDQSPILLKPKTPPEGSLETSTSGGVQDISNQGVHLGQT